MGDVSDFLKELPFKVSFFQELFGSVRSLKVACAKRFDVVELERLRLRIEKEELPLLESLWRSEGLLDRFVKHHGGGSEVVGVISALEHFRHLFVEKTALGTPKIIHIVKLELKALPKDNYRWDEFKALFSLEQGLLERSKTKKLVPIRHTTTGFLTSFSGKNKMILVAIIVLLVGGGFSLFAGEKKAGGGNEVNYYIGQSLNGTIYYLRITKFADSSYEIYDTERYEGISVSSAGYNQDGTAFFIFTGNYIEVHGYLSPTEIIKLYKSGGSSSSIDRVKQAEAYFINGKDLYEKHDLFGARDNFENAVSWNEKSEYYLWLGNVYRDLSVWDKSIAAYNKVLSTDPNNLDASKGLGSAYYGLGSAYYHSKDKEKAIEFWKKAADLGNTDAKTYLEMEN